MTKLKFERQNVDQRFENAIEKGAQIIKRLILKEKLRVYLIRDKLNAHTLNLSDQFKTNITSSDILKRALEILYKDGTFSEKLEQEYIKLISEEVANSVAAGKDLHIVLGEKNSELKQKEMYIDIGEIEKKAKELIE